MIKKSKFISSDKEQVIKKIKSIFLKAKHVAKNVIYLKGWSKRDPAKINVSKLKNKRETKNNFNISFKSYEMKIIKELHTLLRKVKELRYNSFFGKETNKISSDSDEFDNFCEHLVVVDKSISDDFVVGTYRLLHKPKKSNGKGFYSESEFNINNLLNKNFSMLEAGRSCVHEKYRDGRIIKLLWRGLATYIVNKKVELIFGCASFPSSKSKSFEKQLSYLHHYHMPPKDYLTFPHNHLKASFEVIPKNKLFPDQQFRDLPPLIKAYIRAGSWVGPGAVVDNIFDTTDVFIILKTENIIKKYSKLSQGFIS